MPKPTEMLREDHEKVKDLFERFEEADEGEKQEIVTTAIRELEVHTALEEEVFYPAAREALEQSGEDADTISEALEEHHVVKLVIAELKKMRPKDEQYDAKFTVMSENVKHHIEEEENELFPKLEGQLDDEDLAEQMMTRKEELQQRVQSGSRSRSTKSKSRSSSGRGRGKRGSGSKGRKKAASGRR
ncbi:MAG TPA: hemerythrin domain-containing protein [Candidatus Binatia bacterium]|jgi:hemerythrin-like domain-containing protein